MEPGRPCIALQPLQLLKGDPSISHGRPFRQEHGSEKVSQKLAWLHACSALTEVTDSGNEEAYLFSGQAGLDGFMPKFLEEC